MIKIVRMITISGVVMMAMAGISTARAATPPATSNDMTQGHNGGMMGGGMMGGGDMMAGHDKANGKSGDHMMGMMDMMASCSNMMTAQINMMNAMTNEINAQTKLLNQEAASGAAATQK